MVLRWPDRVDIIADVRAGWVRVHNTGNGGGWYSLWALLDRLRDGTAVLK